MLALCLMLADTYYAHNYASIIGGCLIVLYYIIDLIKQLQATQTYIIMHACTRDQHNNAQLQLTATAIALWGERFWQNYILPKSVPHKSHFYSCACTAAWIYVAIKTSQLYDYLALCYRHACSYSYVLLRYMDYITYINNLISLHSQQAIQLVNMTLCHACINMYPRSNYGMDYLIN